MVVTDNAFRGILIFFMFFPSQIPIEVSLKRKNTLIGSKDLELKWTSRAIILLEKASKYTFLVVLIC